MSLVKIVNLADGDSSISVDGQEVYVGQDVPEAVKALYEHLDFDLVVEDDEEAEDDEMFFEGDDEWN
jgi:hypothetical protein